MPKQRIVDRLAVVATAVAGLVLPVYLLLAAAIHAHYRHIAQPPHLHLAQFSALMLLGVAIATAFVSAGKARWVLLWAVPATAFLIPAMYTCVCVFFENPID